MSYSLTIKTTAKQQHLTNWKQKKQKYKHNKKIVTIYILKLTIREFVVDTSIYERKYSLYQPHSGVLN